MPFFGRIFLILCATAYLLEPAPAAQAAKSTGGLALNCATNRVGQYEKIEFTIGTGPGDGNPFAPADVDVTLQLTTPAGKRINLPAFWYQPYERRRFNAGERGRDWFYPTGKAGWKARFAPSETGAYQAVATLKAPDQTSTSPTVRFQCIPSSRKGFLRVSR